jgi:hypothetical protein
MRQGVRRDGQADRRDLPWTLDALEGGLVARGLTSRPRIRTDLRNAGATVVDEEVVVDGQLTTSRSPADLKAFCRRSSSGSRTRASTRWPRVARRTEAELSPSRRPARLDELIRSQGRWTLRPLERRRLRGGERRRKSFGSSAAVSWISLRRMGRPRVDDAPSHSRSISGHNLLRGIAST